MDIIPIDIIRYIGDAYLDLPDIVQWQSVNRKWQTVISNIVWSTIPFDNEILMNRCVYESYDYENNKYKSWDCTTYDDYYKKRQLFDLVFAQ